MVGLRCPAAGRRSSTALPDFVVGLRCPAARRRSSTALPDFVVGLRCPAAGRRSSTALPGLINGARTQPGTAILRVLLVVLVPVIETEGIEDENEKEDEDEEIRNQTGEPVFAFMSANDILDW